MKIKTKIINEETKECLIINQVEAEQLKLKELEVEFIEDGKCFLKGFTPQKPLEQQLQEKKQEKIQELKTKRDEYLQNNETNNDYNLSENDKFNIINLIGYAEEEKQEYLRFITGLKVKYDIFKQAINKAENIKELKNIIIEFKDEEI